MATPQVAVAMDWGGTWTRTAVVNRQGDFLWQTRAPNPQGGSKEEYLAIASKLLGEALTQAGQQAGGSVAGIGVAVAGPVEPVDGTLYQPPNLMVLDGVSLRPLWEEEFSCPVWVGNDANLAALGEFDFGAGKDARDRGEPVKTLFYVTISTGIGGGLVDQGLMYLGANGLTAEVGHITIDTTDGAPECQCGARGCLESLASGTAIAKAARERVNGPYHADSLLADRAPELITSEAVFDAAQAGDALANEILDRVVDSLALGLTNALHMFNPDMVVLGGGVTAGLVRLGLMERIHEGMRRRAMSELHKDFRLVPSALGDSVGLAGAAGMVWDQLGA